jgi:hypothetical protein
VKQRDVSGTVWVVLDVSYNSWDAILVVTTEVNQTVLTLVSSTDVAGGHATSRVTATGLG